MLRIDIDSGEFQFVNITANEEMANRLLDETIDNIIAKLEELKEGIFEISAEPTDESIREELAKELCKFLNEDLIADCIGG